MTNIFVLHFECGLRRNSDRDKNFVFSSNYDEIISGLSTKCNISISCPGAMCGKCPSPPITSHHLESRVDLQMIFLLIPEISFVCVIIRWSESWCYQAISDLIWVSGIIGDSGWEAAIWLLATCHLMLTYCTASRIWTLIIPINTINKYSTEMLCSLTVENLFAI